MVYADIDVWSNNEYEEDDGQTMCKGSKTD